VVVAAPLVDEGVRINAPMVAGWCKSAQCHTRSRKQRTPRRVERKAAHSADP